MPRAILLFCIVALGAVVGDQLIKHLVQERLAHHSPDGKGHAIVLTVKPHEAGITPRALLKETFPLSSPEERERMLERHTRTMSGELLAPDHALQAHDLVRVDHRSLELIPDYLRLEHHQNKNASFNLGMREGGLAPWDMGIIGVVIFLVTFFGLGVLPIRNTMDVSGMALIGAGSLANALDRLVRGHVVDYVVTPWLPPFNLADVEIALGSVLIGVALVMMLARNQPEPIQSDDFD